MLVFKFRHKNPVDYSNLFFLRAFSVANKQEGLNMKPIVDLEHTRELFVKTVDNNKQLEHSSESFALLKDFSKKVSPSNLSDVETAEKLTPIDTASAVNLLKSWSLSTVDPSGLLGNIKNVYINTSFFSKKYVLEQGSPILQKRDPLLISYQVSGIFPVKINTDFFELYTNASTFSCSNFLTRGFVRIFNNFYHSTFPRIEIQSTITGQYLKEMYFNFGVQIKNFIFPDLVFFFSNNFFNNYTLYGYYHKAYWSRYLSRGTKVNNNASKGFVDFFDVLEKFFRYLKYILPWIIAFFLLLVLLYLLFSYVKDIFTNFITLFKDYMSSIFRRCVNVIDSSWRMVWPRSDATVQNQQKAVASKKQHEDEISFKRRISSSLVLVRDLLSRRFPRFAPLFRKMLNKFSKIME
jgi:hypothetical protein